jgi:hypothetical protein
VSDTFGTTDPALDALDVFAAGGVVWLTAVATGAVSCVAVETTGATACVTVVVVAWTVEVAADAVC